MQLDRDALLARLRARADPRRIVLAGAVVAALGLLGVAVMASGDGGGSRIIVAAADDGAATTTTAPEPLPAIDVDKAEPPPTTVAPEPAPVPARTPTTAATAGTAGTAEETVVECLNSYDERCGDFWWTSEPGNEPLLLSVTPSATELAVGEELVLHIVATDADARPHMRGNSCPGGIDWGDGGGYKCSPPLCDDRPRFGPWEPPTPEPGALDVHESTTYASPGVYEIEVWALSGNHCSELYGSDARQRLTVTVVEEPTLPVN